MQKLGCWICDKCSIVIGYGIGPKNNKHLCKECQKDEPKKETKRPDLETTQYASISGALTEKMVTDDCVRLHGRLKIYHI